MRALYWSGRELQFKPAYRAPVAAAQTALVKVQLAGICSTDLQIFKGYMGFAGVPGHEFVGSVVAGPAEWHASGSSEKLTSLAADARIADKTSAGTASTGR